jgi:hypothetical protein
MARLFIFMLYERNCVFYLRYQVFDGTSKHNICNNDIVYDIL